VREHSLGAPRSISAAIRLPAIDRTGR